MPSRKGSSDLRAGKSVTPAFARTERGWRVAISGESLLMPVGIKQRERTDFVEAFHFGVGKGPGRGGEVVAKPPGKPPDTFRRALSYGRGLTRASSLRSFAGCRMTSAPSVRPLVIYASKALRCPTSTGRRRARPLSTTKAFQSCPTRKRALAGIFRTLGLSQITTRASMR